MDLPFLTREVTPIPGIIKDDPEDFMVEEIPLYEASGEGTHVYFEIEKRQLTTIQAVRDIARALNVKARDVGYAGMKDARAVTRQTVSVEHVDPLAVQSLDIPRIQVLKVSRHTNKLKLGHLRGNRFVIKLRQTDPQRMGEVNRVLRVLNERGVPNYFGPQRFGSRGDNWEVGQAMIRQDWEQCVKVLLGRPDHIEHDPNRRARELYEEGKVAEALNTWPRRNRDEQRLCRALLKTMSFRRAFFSVDRTLKQLYISAYQAWLFNQVVAARIDSLDRLMEGDLAWRHGNGAVFRVEDVEKEQPRCDVKEISPSGPLFGYRMTEASGEPGRIEQQPLIETGMTLADFRSPGEHKIKGARRPLRFPLEDASAESRRDDRGDYIELRFSLPSGCYATTVLREVCKRDMA